MQTSLYRRLLPRSSAADPSRVTSDPVRYLSLPDDFSEGVILLVKPPCGSSARRDLKRGFVSSHRPAVRRNAVGQIIRAGRGSVREVSAYSCPERAPEAARRRNVRRPIRYRLKMAFDRISRCFRKACKPPLSPRLLPASCHPTCVSNSVGRVRTSKSFSRHAALFSPSVLTRPLASPSARLQLAGAYLSC